jgi:hypothetical protein
MPTFFDNDRPHDGLRYDEYLQQWKEQTKEELPDGADASDRRMKHYLNYNWKRQERVHEAYDPSADLQSSVESIDESQLWMVLTEPWCGDSAFLLPVVAEAAALNRDVTLRILLRDDNLDVMDQYLTDGSRSIPKLVVFSGDGTERFTWGPRPEGAAQRFQTLTNEYDDKSELIGEFLEYYENGGWRAADTELAKAIQSAADVPLHAAER